MTDETQSDFPTAWRPDQDDPKTIKGHVVAISLSPDQGYGPYPIVTIRAQDGQERAIHAMHQILRTELAKRRPSVGDELEVTYQGKREPKSGNGNSFHAYRVAGGKEPEFNWDTELPAEEREAYKTTDPPIQSSQPRQTVPADPEPMTADPDDEDIPF